MTAVGRVIDGIALAMHWLSGALLVIMVFTVMVDVVTRALFGATSGAVDLTISGGIEIVSYGLLFMVLFTLPQSVAQGQVIVDLFTERLGERAKTRLSALYALGFGLLGSGMALRLGESAQRTAASGETTQDLLIPIWIVYAGAAFASLMLALRSFLVGWRRVVGLEEAQ